MANVLINHQTKNLRYAIEELNEHNLYSWRALGNDFAKKTTPDKSSKVLEYLDLYDTNRSIIAGKIKKYYTDKKIDIIFPLYNDMMFPYIYEILGFTTHQAEILSSKEKYTAMAKRLGIPVPNTYNSIQDADYPVIAKPVNGTGSLGVKVLNNDKEYKYFVSGEDIQYNNLGKHYIYQEFLNGPTVSVAGRIVDNELILDCAYTIESSQLPYRAETGFTFVPKTYDELQLKNYIKLIANELNLSNCVWMADFILKDNDFYLIDFSPRLSVSAQAIIKYGANIDYNKIVLDSLLYKDNTKIKFSKSVLFRYFDIPKGEFQVKYNKNISCDELVLPNNFNYLSRLDVLMPYKGYAITSANSIKTAEEKFSLIKDGLLLTKLD